MAPHRPGGRRGGVTPHPTPLHGGDQGSSDALIDSSEHGEEVGALHMDGRRPGGRRSAPAGLSQQPHSRDAPWSGRSGAAVAEPVAPFRPGGRLHRDGASMHDSPGSREEQQLAAAEEAAADVAGAAAKDLALLAQLADGELGFEPLPDDAMPEGLTPQASHAAVW